MDLLDLKNEFVPKITTGFTGGVGRGGSVCGAFVGAIVGIGMGSGRNQGNDQESLQRSLSLSKQVLDKFLTEYGSEKCSDITGFLLNDPEQYQKYLETGGRDRCIELVKEMTLFTARVLTENFPGLVASRPT
jgi:C_GCAxxG_C_C family probable redox protein